VTECKIPIYISNKISGAGVKRKRMMPEEEDSTMIKILQEKGCSKNLVQKIMCNSKRVRHFSKEEICEAILLRALSTKAYEMLRQNSILPLPHRVTLSRKVKHFQCGPGLQQEFFNLLKLKLSIAEDWERQCIVMFDEMQISQTYEYCPRLKQMFKAHKKVQVVLLR
jgi:hypothetical protein